VLPGDTAGGAEVVCAFAAPRSGPAAASPAIARAKTMLRFMSVISDEGRP
jgi:hypothetical protein